MAAHAWFVVRTVMVRGGDVEAAAQGLNRILSTDGIVDEVKRRQYYEKPCRKRIRENYENCRRVYNTEMARKFAFLMRAIRQDPWLGC